MRIVTKQFGPWLMVVVCFGGVVIAITVLLTAAFLNLL